MTQDSSQRAAKSIYRFLGGAAAGGLVILVPVTYGATSFGLTQLGIASAVMLSCGLLSVRWGEKFIDAIARVLNNTGL